MDVCVVCEEETNYQKFLNCGSKTEKHKLCQICLEKLAKPVADVNLGKTVKCPLCRRFTSLPNGDAGKLRTKLFVEMVCEDCLLSKDIQDQCWCKTCEATTCSLCIKEKHRKHKCSNWEKHDVTKELLTFLQQREEKARCEGFRRKFKEFSQQLETKLLENFKTEQNYSELFDSIEYCFGTLLLRKPKKKEISISNFRKKYTIVGDLMKSTKLAVPAIDINDMCEKVEKDVEVLIDFPELNDVLKLFVVNNSTSTAPKEATKVVQNENGYSITEVQSEKEKGNQAYLRKDFATAHQHYDRCIDLDPRNITFLLNKSGVCLEEGKYEDWKCLCSKAVGLWQVNQDNNHRGIDAIQEQWALFQVNEDNNLRDLDAIQEQLTLCQVNEDNNDRDIDAIQEQFELANQLIKVAASRQVVRDYKKVEIINRLKTFISKQHNVAAARQVVRDDKKTLDRLKTSADKNDKELGVESSRLAKYAYASCNFWIWIILLPVCLMFIGMALFTRIFTKR